MRYSFKTIVISLISLYLIIAFLFFNFYKNLAIHDTKQEAISILNTIKASRNYIESVQRPLLYKLKAEGRLDEDFFDPRISSSSYITKGIYDLLLKHKKINYSYRLSAINPTNPDNMANSFEAKLLREFQDRKRSQYFDILEENGTDYFYVAIPIDRNKPSCLECHGDPSNAPVSMIKRYGNNGFYEKTGDIRAIISLKAPVREIVTYHIQEFTIGGLAMLVSFIIFIFFAYLLYKQEIKLQNKKEKLLENQNKLASMGEMINNIAHQWRQPLAHVSSILVNLELRSKKGKLTPEIVEEKAHDAYEQISYMSETIESFRNFYIQQESKVFHIAEAITQAVHLTDAALDENQIDVEIEIENDCCVLGNMNDLIQAIINIINNAKDALVEKHIKNRKIIIKCNTDSDTSRNFITIEDNAGGIPDKIINKIFDPYFTTKHPSIGTGVGLYMCKTIVEKKFGGTLRIENTPVGARFIIALNCYPCT